ncbi:MAG TPA: hypothetical protein VNA30_05735 [Mycobacteriales bacterium]|nr:hypothetical protein [Mycobacteriales bacterium]
MDAESPDLDPVPAPYDGRDEEPSVFLYELEVDGEVFALSSRGRGTHYKWLSGPNQDYGFSSFSSIPLPEPLSEEEHRESIRSFLGMIDPATGYIED